MAAGHKYSENTPDWRKAGFFPDLTLAQAFAKHAALAPDRPIVFWSAEREDVTTVGEMHREAKRIAAGLEALGVGAGDVVGLQVGANKAAALAFQAVSLLGAVVLPIVHIYGPSETSYVLAQSQAKVFIAPDRLGRIDFLANIAQLEPLPDLKQIIIVGDVAPPGAILWKDFVANAPDAPIRSEAKSADDVALLLFTSGTTSAPKGVQHSHNTLLAETNITMIPADGSDRTTLSAYPLGHIAGILVFLKAHLGGIPTIMMERWDAPAAARLIQERKVFASAGVPVMLSDLLEYADTGAADISSLQSYQAGAASVPPALMEHAERYGIFPFRSYGCSEHPSITRGGPDDPRDKRINTDGRCSPGNEVRIINDSDVDVAVGEEGEIVSRGPEMFLGYRDASLTPGVFMPGGWYRTGDIGRMDHEGYLTITDRKKDIIIRGGENISSKEVEDILVRHPAILESAVVAQPHPRLGEVVHAFIMIRPGFTAPTMAEVQAHFDAAGVARQKTPEGLTVVDDFPRTAAGKIKKFELRDSLR